MPIPCDMAAPLSGIRVIDLTRLLPGAFATLMLAELGADVVKVEHPDGGDPMRQLPPLIGDRGLYDLLLNRGKRSVALELGAPGSAEVFERLVATADVVIESFRPRTARRLGVSAAQVRDRHPRLVHCAITGYGQTGPYAERPGHDLNYVSVSGLLAADRPDPSELPRMFIADVGGGAMHAVVGILSALLGRERHGDGASLDISMHDAALYWVMLPAARELVEAGTTAVGELPTFGRHACYNVYETADGRQVALGALEPKFWVAFCEAIERRDLVDRHVSDDADQQALIAEIGQVFAGKTRAEWIALFADHDVCLTPVNRPDEALADPHIVARRTVTPAGRGARAIRPPFLTEPVDLGRAPAVGEHTAQILGPLRP